MSVIGLSKHSEEYADSCTHYNIFTLRTMTIHFFFTFSGTKQEHRCTRRHDLQRSRSYTPSIMCKVDDWALSKHGEEYAASWIHYNIFKLRTMTTHFFFTFSGTSMLTVGKVELCQKTGTVLHRTTLAYLNCAVRYFEIRCLTWSCIDFIILPPCWQWEK